MAQPEPEEEAKGGRRRRRGGGRGASAAAAAKSCAFHLSSPGRTGAAAVGPGRGQHAASPRAPPPGSGPDTQRERESGGGGGGGRMQAKKPGGSSGGGRSGELQGDEAQRNKKKKKKVSCFSNIKIFLVSECALMLAQGTVGAYLVSLPCQVRHGPLPQRGSQVPDWQEEGAARAPRGRRA